MKSTIIASLVATAALAGAGCAIDEAGDEPGDEPADEVLTGQTQQEVSSFGIWNWGCSSGPCALDLGVITGRTCFLAGVWGNLQPSSGGYSQVQVIQSGGHWGLQIVPAGNPLGGTAVCIPGTTVKQGSWFSGAAETNLGSGAQRRCFLSGVINIDGMTNWTDYLRVRQVAGTWFLGGNIPAGKDTRAAAICVDVPTAGGDFGMVVSDGFSNLHAAVQDNNPWGWACGLKKLGGHFTTNAWNDGVWLEYNNGISMWELNGVNGKQATVSCVK